MTPIEEAELQEEPTFYPNRKMRRQKIKFKIGKLDQPAWKAKVRANRRAHRKFVKKQRRLNEQKNR